MKYRLVSLFALVVITCLVGLAADIDGTWMSETQSKGDPQTLTLKSDGDKLTGSMGGGRGGPVNISEGIVSFNEIITEESTKRGLRVVDIFPLSKKMGEDISLVAADGLHPSAKEYAEWERIIFPAALELLKR